MTHTLRFTVEIELNEQTRQIESDEEITTRLEKVARHVGQCTTLGKIPAVTVTLEKLPPPHKKSCPCPACSVSHVER